MRNRTLLIGFLAGFVCLCGFFVMDSGLFDNAGATPEVVSLASVEDSTTAAPKAARELGIGYATLKRLLEDQHQRNTKG